MAEVTVSLTEQIVNTYNSLLNSLPDWGQTFVNLFFLILVVFLYSFFVWKFYGFIAKKNLFEFDLNRFNRSNTKFLAAIFYFLEYIIILPFIIFFWFGIFTIFLIFLTENLEVSAILVVSAVIIAVIRIACYYKEDLAKDLAKLLPFTLLAVSVANPSFFKFDRILGNLTTLPSLFNNILVYLAFIIILEVILRFFDFIFSLFGLEEPAEEEED